MRTLRTVIGLAAGAVALSGCSLIATSSSPQVLNPHPVPFGLLGKTIPGTVNGRVRFITQPVYIVDATGHLSQVSRIVPSPPTLASVLRQLVLGPTDIETLTGFTSALPKDTIVYQAFVKAHVGYIDLARPLSSLAHGPEVLAIGQLVFTAHYVGATRGIEVQVGGVAQPLLLPNGDTKTLVTEADYQSLLNP
jgi:Sporulation and spore germination